MNSSSSPPPLSPYNNASSEAPTASTNTITTIRQNTNHHHVNLMRTYIYHSVTSAQPYIQRSHNQDYSQSFSRYEDEPCYEKRGCHTRRDHEATSVERDNYSSYKTRRHRYRLVREHAIRPPSDVGPTPVAYVTHVLTSVHRITGTPHILHRIGRAKALVEIIITLLTTIPSAISLGFLHRIPMTPPQTTDAFEQVSDVNRRTQNASPQNRKLSPNPS